MPQPIAPLITGLLRDGDTMYARELNANGTTKHSRHCQSTFGRRDWNCHRCVELILGAAPRDGWQHEYFARKLRQAQRSFSWE
jgi:formamidopyrimidine-DNA glycosylase